MVAQLITRIKALLSDLDPDPVIPDQVLLEVFGVVTHENDDGYWEVDTTK